MDLHDKTVTGSKAVFGGRVGTENGKDIKDGSPVRVPNGISDGQEDGLNQGVFLYSNRGWTA